MALLGAALFGVAYAGGGSDTDPPSAQTTDSALEQTVTSEERGVAVASTTPAQIELATTSTSLPVEASERPSRRSGSTTSIPPGPATTMDMLPSGEEPLPDLSGQPVVPTSGSVAERFAELARQFPYPLLYLDAPQWELTSLEAVRDPQGSYLVVSTYAHAGGEYFISLNQQTSAQARELPSGEVLEARGTQVQMASMGANQFLASWAEAGSTILLFSAHPQESLTPLIEGLNKTD